MEKILLVIDDSAAFREAISLAGEDHGWVVLASDDLKEIESWLANHSPDVVLLDWQLPGQQRQQYINLLTNEKLTECTLLLSAAMSEARQQFIKAYGLAGSRLKPLDLGRFEEEIKLPVSQSATVTRQPGLEIIADGLEVAVNILDGNLNILWSNRKAKQEPPTSAQRLIIKWLRAEMEAKEHKAARRLDWDGEKKCFLESRLFKLINENYWLALDWRGDGEWPHEHEILNLENVHTLKDWLRAVARLLAQRYAISRFRMYKIAPLPYMEKFEHPDISLLVIPFLQGGGGFEPNEDTWLRTGFLANENLYTKKALEADYKPAPEPVSDTNQNIGCKSIRYGEKGTYRVLFPIRGQDNRISALFAMDRRLDHAATLEEGSFDREVVETAKRMASDDAGALSHEQWSLMRGLIQDLGKRLAARLAFDEDDRTKKWHKTISKTIKETFADAGRSPEMTYEGLSQVCFRLAKAWNDKTISGHVMGTSPYLQLDEINNDKNKSISTWYIALLTDDIHWQAVAGWGTAYEVCHQYGAYELTEPHKTAKATAPWKAAVIQDFQDWIQKIENNSYCCVSNDQSDPIGSWLAVPIQIDKKVRGLMVVHSPHAHYFTAFRVGLMEDTAERLLSLLAAAQRETRARSAFAASVMHEVKNDSHAALMILGQIQQEAAQTKWITALAEVYHYLEELEALGRDTLNIFQLGQGERIQEQRESDKDLSITLESLINSAIVGWRTLYDDTTLDIKMPETMAARKVSIKRLLAFKRVLRVLLHNAFRHGREWVHIEVTLDEGDEANRGRWLNITIKNLIAMQVACDLAERFNPTIGDSGSSPLIRGRLGLVVAHQLATEAGAILTNLEWSPSDSNVNVEAIIKLAWPITPVDDILESTP